MRRPFVGTSVVVTMLGLALLGGCGGDEELNEARLLIDRLDGLDEPNLAERRRRVNALSALPIDSERVKEVRDECVPMQEALLVAEEASAELRVHTEALEAGDQSAGARAAEALERSEQSLVEAQAHRERCDSLLTGLRTHFAPRRGQ